MKDIFFKEQTKYIVNALASEDWIVLYSKEEAEEYRYTYFAFLAPERKYSKILSTEQWAFGTNLGPPEIVRYADEREKYFRYGNDGGYEPIIIYMFYNNLEPARFELCEEFRHYFNLYYNAKTKHFIRVDPLTSEESEVAYLDENLIKVKTRFLKEFLALKKMYLVVNFDCFHFYKTDLRTFEPRISTSNCLKHKDDSTIFKIDFQEGMPLLEGCNSRLLGKKIIFGFKNFKPKNPFNIVDNKKYADFIIGYGEDGEEITFTSNPNMLGNYFGKDDAPHFLTQVFFSRDVLLKYYSDLRKYTIEDSVLFCKGSWYIPIDNNHNKYVIVYLGDLGRDLPFNEQMYWRSHNILPDGSMSDVKYHRDILNKSHDAISPDIVFKNTYLEFQEKWMSKYGYYLIKPLREDDLHYFNLIRIPLNPSSNEFETLVLSLTKTIIDSINEEHLKFITGKEDKGINLLDHFLRQYNYGDAHGIIQFLRKLQGLRSSAVAHRKGNNYIDSMKYFKLNELTTIEVYRDMLTKVILLIEGLRKHFL